MLRPERRSAVKLLRSGAPEPMRRVFSLAEALRRAGYKPGRNGGSVSVRIKKGPDGTRFAYYNHIGEPHAEV